MSSQVKLSRSTTEKKNYLRYQFDMLYKQ